MTRAVMTRFVGTTLIIAGLVALPPTRPVQADAASVGSWGAPFSVDVVAIHAALLPTGNVLLFSFPEGTVGSRARVWDPKTGGVGDVSVPFTQDVYCSGHTLLPDGRLFAAGGHVLGTVPNDALGVDTTAFFHSGSEQWTQGPRLSIERWYPTNIALPDGRVLIFSGQKDATVPAPTVESFDPTTNSLSQLPPSATRYLGWYPRLHVLPTGKILWDNTGDTMLFDPASNRWSSLASTNFGTRNDTGNSVLLPGLRKVLIFGGNNSANGVTGTAEIIDFADPQPDWRYTAPMNFPRMWANAVLLADGTVLAVGGATGGRYSGPVKQSEIFDPKTETWTPAASQVAPRMYHSTALLLPDGRVLSAGQDKQNRAYRHTGEIYTPPYLFKGPRPTIASAPPAVDYGDQFTIATPNATDIRRVALVRLGSVTHSVDFEQRYVDLTFAPSGGSSLQVSAPLDGNIAPPGWYMLFILSSSGVPSVASMIHVAGVAPQDTTPPAITERLPFPDATGVSISTNVTATFSEAVDPATIAFTLRDAGGTSVPAAVTYDEPSRTVTMNPGADLAESAVYAARVVGAKDLAGNTMTDPAVWSFTTGSSPPPSPSPCPCTIWSDSATPTTASTTDLQSIEVGVKFRPSVDGVITGLRFYKGGRNTGTHVAHVWTIDGELLGGAPFTGESALGWQQSSFSSPIPVRAGVTYVASYSAPSGGYARDRDYFATSSVINGPLEALADGVAGGNGVFNYGPSGTFPTRSSRASNYWVDVVFDTAG